VVALGSHLERNSATLTFNGLRTGLRQRSGMTPGATVFAKALDTQPASPEPVTEPARMRYRSEQYPCPAHLVVVCHVEEPNLGCASVPE
jgi:hypothetical protein